MAKGEARNFNQLHQLLVHLGAATVAQTGSLLCRRMAFGRSADCQSATQQTASLRYEPVSIRIGGSAKRPPAMVLKVSVWRCYESSF